MTEAEFLERFDRHIERMDAHIERMDARGESIDALMGRGNELMGEVREEIALSRQTHEDLRVFTRDLTRRNERVLDGMMRTLDDMGDQIRANTQAVLAVLDRLGGSATA